MKTLTVLLAVALGTACAFAKTATWTYSVDYESPTDHYLQTAEEWTPSGALPEVGDDLVLDTRPIAHGGAANLSPGWDYPYFELTVRSLTVYGNENPASILNFNLQRRYDHLPLTIGAGGMTFVPFEDPATFTEGTRTSYFPNLGNTTVWVAEDQVWKMDRGNFKALWSSTFACDLASTNDVLLQIGGRHHLLWKTKPTTNYQGRVTFNNMNILLSSAFFNRSARTA